MSDKTSNLLPCPLCGKGFIKNSINAYEHDNEECILHGFEISNEKLLKQWNTRKPMDDIVERLEKIKDIAWDEEYQTVCDVIEIVKEVGGSCD